MGVIIDELREVLERNIRDHGLVAWFDPDRHYESALDEFQLGGCHFLRFNGSYYALRAEAEALIRGLEAPKLLVYMPVAYDMASLPLTELLAFGVSLRPGAIGQLNTKLAVIARRALKKRVAETRLTELDRQIEKGQLTLVDLEQLGDEGGGEALPTVLAVLFGTSAADEAALDFLAHPNRDAELAARNGFADWAQALRTHFGIPVGPEQPMIEVRTTLARQVLCAELLDTLGDDAPTALKTVVSSKEVAVRRRCADLAAEWRNRRDLGSSYREAAASVEKALHLASLDFSVSALDRVQTFAGMERCLLRRIASRLALGEDTPAMLIAERHLVAFWSQQEPDLQAEWSLIVQAASLLSTATEVETALQKPHTAEDCIRAYTRAENPWSNLDTLQRRLEKRASSLEFALSEPPAEIEALVTRARQRYSEAAGRLAEAFLRSWQKDGFQVGGFHRQTQVYERFVAPLVREHRTAYLMVDALRYELARELVDLLSREFETQMDVVIGTAPSVTEVGMVALLPSADTGLRLSGNAKLMITLHGEPMRNRQDRMDYVRKSADAPATDLRLEEPKSFKRKLKDMAAGPALVVVTSREIDQSGEDETTGAREQMEKVLTQVSLALRKLAEAGIERFVIAADHGYIFGEDLAESEKIDAPGGKTALLHRRVWVGQGGTTSDSYLRTSLSKLGLVSDLEIAVPWNLTGFRTSGPTAYFHGGLSPQEILLPVLTLVPRNWATGQNARKISWELALGSPKITTRFLSVRITGQSQSLFDAEWPRVRLEVRTGADVCSMPVVGTYGFNEATGEVVLRSSEADPRSTEPNTVALMLTGKAPTSGAVSVHLMDTTTGAELKKIENVEVSIAI